MRNGGIRPSVFSLEYKQEKIKMPKNLLREGHCVGPLGHVVTRASLKLRENHFMSLAGTSLTDLIPEETNE